MGRQPMEQRLNNSLLMMTRCCASEVIIEVDGCEGRREVGQGKPKREAAHRREWMVT